MIEQLVQYLAVSAISDIMLRRQAQQSALTMVRTLIGAQIAQLTALCTPAPLTLQEGQPTIRREES